MANIPLVPGTLSSTCYPSDPQALYNEMFEKGSGLVDDLTGIIISATEPDPEDRDKAWLKLSSAGGPPAISLPLVWFNGKWVARHQSTPSGSERRLWVGTPTNLETFDGGSAGAVSDVSGPMWEVDTAFDGRVPVGAGTFPNTSPPVTIAAGSNTDSAGQTGEYQHTLTVDELPAHHHPLEVFDGPVTAGTHPQGYIGTTSQGTFDTDDTGGDDPHNNMPPMYGAYFIKRTARIYYTGS